MGLGKIVIGIIIIFIIIAITIGVLFYSNEYETNGINTKDFEPPITYQSEEGTIITVQNTTTGKDISVTIKDSVTGVDPQNP